MAGCEGLRGMVCPKPRRLGLINDHIRPLRSNNNVLQSEFGDSQVGTELLDIILTEGKGNYNNNQVSSSPPYFSGSPPSRSSNPVTQNEQFSRSIGAKTVSPSSCLRGTFGLKPAAVRIEGFDCLGGDRRNCTISAVA